MKPPLVASRRERRESAPASLAALAGQEAGQSGMDKSAAGAAKKSPAVTPEGAAPHSGIGGKATGATKTGIEPSSKPPEQKTQ